ncbi:MAG: hypothetical protein QOD39_5609 [Mycobacterium sp.]|jgi:hypothetical protein|nr:hypothetical protein [Mycobacterium sp.]
MTNDTTTRIARYIALPIASAAMIGAAALGLAGIANAAATEPTGPGYSYAPAVKAHPAPNAQPGWRNHHGVHHIENLDLGYAS